MLLGYRSTNWKSQPHWRSTQITGKARSWVFDHGSLTARLIGHVGNGFRVQRLRETWAYPTLDEANDLGIPHKQYCWIREVMLLNGNTPLVVARSVVPQKSLKGENQVLRHLGDKPLGGFLFSNPTLERGAIEAAHLYQWHPLYRMANQATNAEADALWGRRSVFRINHKPLLVAEIFLPQCLAL